MKAATTIGALAAAIVCATASAGSARIQCWTDDQGHRACGNAVPAQYADKEREVLNKRGEVVETKARAATIEEKDAPAKDAVAGTAGQPAASATGQQP